MLLKLGQLLLLQKTARKPRILLVKYSMTEWEGKFPKTRLIKVKIAMKKLILHVNMLFKVPNKQDLGNTSTPVISWSFQIDETFPQENDAQTTINNWVIELEM